MQVDALHAAGVTSARLFVDKASGAKTDRPVWKVFGVFAGRRFAVGLAAGSPRAVYGPPGRLVEELQQRGVGFRSICIANRSMKRPKRLSATFVSTSTFRPLRRRMMTIGPVTYISINLGPEVGVNDFLAGVRVVPREGTGADCTAAP